jgi:hypothetical protein
VPRGLGPFRLGAQAIHECRRVGARTRSGSGRRRGGTAGSARRIDQNAPSLLQLARM